MCIRFFLRHTHDCTAERLALQCSGFVSEEFETYLTRNGVKHITSAPYHPSTNGLAERTVQVVKKGLKKEKEGSMILKLARVLMAYRTTPHSTTGVMPSELLQGRQIRT